jgi:hypothetical protein
MDYLSTTVGSDCFELEMIIFLIWMCSIQMVGLCIDTSFSCIRLETQWILFLNAMEDDRFICKNEENEESMFG